MKNGKLKDIQKDFIDKMDCLIKDMETDIRKSKRKRFVNLIEKEIKEDESK